MAGKFTNKLQTAILFDRGIEFDATVRLDALQRALSTQGLPTNVVQRSGDSVVLMGPRDLHILITCFDHPAQAAVFEPTLGSPITHISFPDARERIVRHRTHILVDVFHGVFGGVSDDARISAMLGELGMKPGATLEDFKLRVEILSAVCRHILSGSPATAVHWTQSNMLVAAERFAQISQGGHPGLLTVHPKLFGAEPVPGFREPPAGLYTLGAADYIGREVYVAPAPIPWVEHMNAVFAFITMAIMDGGYIMPDGDSLGPESGDYSYRIKHLDADRHPAGVNQPLYALKLMFSREHGYTTMEYETREKVAGSIRAAAEEIDAHERDGLVKEWQDQDSKLRSIGGRLDIYRRGDEGEPSPTIRFGPFGKRATFGRRQ